MPFFNDLAELDRLWPVLGHGTRHSLDCHWSMIHQFKNQNIYPKVTCKCGLDMWLRMKKIRPKTGQRVKELGWL